MANKENSAVVECEEWFYLSLKEITHSLDISAETIIEMIDESIIIAKIDEKNEWQFDKEAYKRIRTALHLNKDLGINWAGAGLALELLTEIDRLHMLLEKHHLLS